MKYYNIHTHFKDLRENIISIYCLTEDEIQKGLLNESQSIYYSCGIHPWNVDHTILNIEDLSRLISRHKNVVAIGEVGLDKLHKSSYAMQIDFFEKQILLSEEMKLPLIIHCVKAWDDLIRLYKKHKPASPWIIHGFRGGKQQAEQFQNNGFYLSFGENFNSEALFTINKDKLLLETDVSEVSIENIYRKVSHVLGLDEREIKRLIKQNVSFLFKIA